VTRQDGHARGAEESKLTFLLSYNYGALATTRHHFGRGKSLKSSTKWQMSTLS
jgi:hypothetical protein